MDSIGKFLSQALARFRSLPINHRVAIVAVAALVVVSLLWLVKFGTGTADREYLFGGREFSRDEIVAIETALGDASLGDWKVVGYRVEIPSGEKARYLAALSSNEIPLGIDVPPEKSSPFDLQRDRMIQAKYQKQLKMGRVVERMPGIQEVAVEYTESKSAGFPRTVEKRAAVAVQAVAGRHLNPQEVAAIQSVIVASEAGLSKENVVVLDINAKRSYDGTSAASEMPAHSLADGTRKIYEDRLRQQIHNRLVNYPGLVVEVSAEPAASSDTGNNGDSDHLALQGLAVSIGVPSSYYQRLWKKRHGLDSSSVQRPNRLDLAEVESETLRKVEEIVAGLLNEIDLPDARRPNIVVRTDEDFETEDPVAQANNQWLWTSLSQRGQPLLIALLALVIVAAWLVISKRQKKKAGLPAPPDQADAALMTPRKSSETVDGQSEESAGASGNSGNLQDQLSQLVQQDPDAAVDALRRWVRKVA